MVVGLLGDTDGLLQRQVSLVAARTRETPALYMHLRLMPSSIFYLLVAEATMQAGQVESSVPETSPITLVAVTLSLITRQDEAVEIMQEAVGGEEDVLDSHAVQVV